MANALPGFNPDEFRTAIRFAMGMGAPPDEEMQATFVFPRAKTVTGPADASGMPYGPEGRVAEEPARKVRVPCGIEHAGTAVETQTSVGRMAPNRITVTLLDEDYATVAGFEAVVVGGVPYYFLHELPPTGLGPVGVHQIVCRSEGEA